MSEIEGFDPLVSDNAAGGLDNSVATEAIRREVLNILKSYTGYFDIFSELLQNALDAVDVRRAKEGEYYIPRVEVEIDLQRNVVRVSDNGCGMSLDEFKFCFRPNVSFKSRKESRGHKGVGATFIAYGFSYVKLATAQDGTKTVGQLTNGRKWAEDTSGSYPRPTFSQIEAIPEHIQTTKSGTSIEVGLEPEKRPILSWIQASNAAQWLSLLRIKTPIGGVYLSATEREFDVHLRVVVVDHSGTRSEESSDKIDYYYPHEIPLISKAKTISEIDHQVGSVTGDPNTRLSRLPDDFRRLDAVWEVWKADEILTNDSFVRNLEDVQKVLLQRHNVTIYGCFFSTAKTWTAFQKDVLRVRPNAVLLRGGLQMASDYMPQGDLSVIPLTSTIGYQNNTHIVIHLEDGNPDMGRKVFQPEIKAVADELSRRVVDHFKQYLSLMREDTGAAPMNTARDLRDYVLRQEDNRREHPYALRYGEQRAAILSTPQSEQDVIALFHELHGMGLLRGLGFLATSESNIYDSIFVTQYDSEEFIYSVENSLGVSRNIDRRESVPYILEYKFDSDALVDDFAKEKKFVGDIDLLVCWNIGPKTSREFNVSAFLVGDEGSVRTFFGATHALYQGREKRMEVICLEDLSNFLRGPEDEIARQTQLYQ